MLTIEVSEREKIPMKTIQNAIALRKLDPPGKDRSGRYVWTEEDVTRLREVARVDRRFKATRANREEHAHVA